VGGLLPSRQFLVEQYRRVGRVPLPPGIGLNKCKAQFSPTGSSFPDPELGLHSNLKHNRNQGDIGVSGYGTLSSMHDLKAANGSVAINSPMAEIGLIEVADLVNKST
jgi:hypothetical protein